ncbi:hypothetical protein E5161_07430 [Cohnella pontilimi]|uniref:Tyr recombinase domain-containing protein n=1 Tax=Cohnella pontilimi TaxID=2564100 RepID=A0A4U0FCQ5_9BACL|nr:site-specific integrase [Cohnella pontilimi]TJY42673.1 hypothetical protein E5161_07430 [Cohnella pontilimi]
MEGILFESHYFRHWQDNVNISSGSKQVYIIRLKLFQDYLESQGFEGKLDFDKFHGSRDYPDRFLPIQESFIDRFVHFMQEAGKPDSSLSITVSALKNFFGYLSDMELICRNPMEDYPLPRYQRPIKNSALSKEECLALLHAAIKKDPFFRQDFVMIWFMLITGLRITEVRLLRRSKVDLDNRMVIINEGQKTDSNSVSISLSLALELQRYVNHPSYLKWEKQGSEYLFNRKGKAFPYQYLLRKIKKLCKEAGLSKVVTPHDLRRTAGYLMQAGGMNLIEVQRQLRHRILATTLRYIPPLEDLARILEETS